MGSRTAGWAVRRAWEILRAQGPRALWFKLLGEGVYRRMIVTELLLPAPDAAPGAPPGAEGRFLGPDDLPAYARLHGTDSAARERFARGERCFGVWVDGALASTRWFASGTAHVDHLERAVGLPPGTVYIHDVYVDPAQRGRRIASLAAVEAPRLLAAEGVRRIVGVLDPENVAGMRHNRSYQVYGYRDAGRIGWVRLGPWRRDFGSL